MQQTCTNCGTQFEITDSDLAFYDKVSPVINDKKYSIPPPTHCPDCRQQRRLAIRNENHLYSRKCDLCNRSIIATFDSESPYKIYCPDCWWSDKWEPKDYGIDYDFKRTFFDQFEDLLNKVPKSGVLQLDNENSEYNSLLAFSKNTYMSPGSYLMENCIYIRKGQECNDCLDGNILNKCELVSNSTNCDGCYSAHFLVNCRNCSDCKYLQDCSSLKNCFMCCGLNKKEYCIKNKQHSKEVYEKELKEYESKSPEALWDEFMEFSLTIPRKSQIQLNCEGSSGDYLYNCKNAVSCYDCFDIEDSKYMFECTGDKDCMDLSMHDKNIELCMEMSSGGESNFLTKFCYCTIASPRSMYMHSCFYVEDSFGCDGIHSKGKYCILNKQYTKEEYEELVPKIIEHMKSTEEWGEFFPMSISPFAYNETVAQEYFPMTKAEVISKGWKWRDEEDEIPEVEKIIPAEKLPDKIEDIPDDVLNWAIKCEATNRPFRIVKQELEFYRKMNLPIPHLHPDERHKRRMELRNPRKLWKRDCDKCGKEMETTYAPERPERVFCEECYLKEVY